MPLQKSVYKVKGKMDGMSYFYSKNGGYQFRTINPAMSDLVKNDPRFEMTREYGYAFGLGASFSGALLKCISNRWRYILRANTHAELTKKYDLYFKASQGLIDGQIAHISLFYDRMMRDFNNLNKRMIPPFLSYFFPRYTEENVANNQLDINRSLYLTRNDADEYKSRGADGVSIYLYTLRVRLKSQEYLPNNKVYYEGEMSSLYVIQNSITFSNLDQYELLPASTPALDGRLSPEIETCGGILVYVAPFKTIDGQNHILQSLCNAFWYAPETSK